MATGRLLAQMPGDLSSPIWSRDGERLAYLAPSERRDPPGGRDLMMWEAKSGAVTRVMAYEPAARLVGWSPDGEWIYYTGTVRTESPDVSSPARRVA